MAIQTELFPTNKFAEEFLTLIKKRLGNRTEVTVSDVCAACDVSANKVYAWIESGEVVAVDHGTNAKKYYKIFTRSVIGHYQRKLVGALTDNAGASS